MAEGWQQHAVFGSAVHLCGKEHWHSTTDPFFSIVRIISQNGKPFKQTEHRSHKFETEQKKKRKQPPVGDCFLGGRYKTRTCDLPHVKRMRYQLRQSSVFSARVILAHEPWKVKRKFSFFQNFFPDFDGFLAVVKIHRKWGKWGEKMGMLKRRNSWHCKFLHGILESVKSKQKLSDSDG